MDRSGATGTAVDQGQVITVRAPRRLSLRSATIVFTLCLLVALGGMTSLIQANAADRRNPPIRFRASLYDGELPATGSDVSDFRLPVAHGLGRFPSLGDWREQSPNGRTASRWRTDRGAAIADVASGAETIIVVNTRHPTYILQADVTKPARGSGIVFRYRDPGHYWKLVSVTRNRWDLVKVRDGSSQRVESLILDTPPVYVPSAASKGDRINLYMYGAHVALADPYLADASAIGLISTSPDTTFDNVAVFDG